jgi:hypothetical protein
MSTDSPRNHAAAPYSEDIDLVQFSAGPIGGVLDAIRSALDPWLWPPSRTTKEGRMSSEGQPPVHDGKRVARTKWHGEMICCARLPARSLGAPLSFEC